MHCIALHCVCVCVSRAFSPRRALRSTLRPHTQRYHHLYLISLSGTNSLWSLTSHGCAEPPGASIRFFESSRVESSRVESTRTRRPTAIIRTITLPLEWKAAGYPEARQRLAIFDVATARTDEEKSPGCVECYRSFKHGITWDEFPVASLSR